MDTLIPAETYKTMSDFLSIQVELYFLHILYPITPETSDVGDNLCLVSFYHLPRTFKAKCLTDCHFPERHSPEHFVKGKGFPICMLKFLQICWYVTI